ncbi:MAG: penicillin-binding protein [Bacteroidota bacterium]
MVADRGNFLSEDGTIMATSLPFFKIGLDPGILDTTKFVGWQDSVYKLAILLHNSFGNEETDTLLYFNRIANAMRKGDRHVYLTRKLLSQKQLQEAKTWPILRLGRFKGGLVVEKLHNKRHYPFQDLASITLGRMANDTVGIRGLEYSFNTHLRGRDGYILAQKVAGKSYIPLDQYGQEHSEDGYDVVTTLDVDIQDMVEKALKRGVDKNQAKFGTAILLETRTGKIKALANYPDNYNYAVAMRMEPGSTIKLASAIAALEDTLLDVCDTVDTGDGTIKYDDWEIRDGYGYGKIPFEKVFAKSSNVGMSKVIFEGFGERPSRYLWYLEQFGLTEPVNRQLVGEPEPDIIRPGDKMWNITTLPSMSYGYSMQVTPLQLATFYNAVANEGTLMRPWLVKEVRDDSRILKQYGPEVINEEICSEATLWKIRDMMEQVVEYGTARNINNTPFRIAGKTGTSRKTRGGQYVKEYRASFAGYFPAENPRYTCYVLVDEPQGEYYGASVAAPIFKEIAQQVYKFDWKMAKEPKKKHTRPIGQPNAKGVFATHAKKVYRELGITTSEVGDSVEFVRARTNGHQVNLTAMKISEDRIPNVRGLNGRDALLMLEKLGVQVSLKGYGTVRRQSLLPGYRIGKNTQITLYLG